MTTSSSPLHVDYVEIGVTDIPTARAFYGEAFGWEFNDYGPGYAGIRSAGGDGEVGGLNAERAPGTGGPLLLLRTGDLAATHAAVLEAGGRVQDAPYEYPGGRRFTFRDPSGNVLGVYQPVG